MAVPVAFPLSQANVRRLTALDMRWRAAGAGASSTMPRAKTQFVLDASASMGFGSHGQPTKFAYAARLAAGMAHVTARGGGAVGLTLFGETVRDHLPPRRGPAHVRRLCARLAAAVPGGRAAPAELARTLAASTGRVYLFTDLCDGIEGALDAVAPLCRGGGEVTLMQVLDPTELDLLPGDAATFTDPETGEALSLDPDAIRAEYRGELQRDIDAARAGCAALGAGYYLLSTVLPIYGFMRDHARRECLP